jgi:hypothetical protein
MNCDPTPIGDGGDQWHAADMAMDGLTLALEDFHRAQDELVDARNRLVRDRRTGHVRHDDLTGYPPDRVLRSCRDAGIST